MANQKIVVGLIVYVCVSVDRESTASLIEQRIAYQIMDMNV